MKRDSELRLSPDAPVGAFRSACQRYLPATLLALLLCFRASAATITAASNSASSVQAAIDSARSGDTVMVPAGSGTWSTVVTISGKALTLQGAGVGKTTITDGTTGSTGILNVTCTASNLVRVTGFTFVAIGPGTGNLIAFQGTSSGGTPEVGFRFDHNAITLSKLVRGITVTGIYGLIDHSTFTATVYGSLHAVDVFGSSRGSDGGFTPWTRPLTLGSDNAVYIEDNTFDYRLNDQGDDCVDAYSGARLVIRHNSFLDISVGFHGTDSGGSRSTHSFEIYNNSFVNNSTHNLRYLTVRGGTGVVFSNTYGGTANWYGVTLLYYRATQAESDWQQCTGIVWQLGSTKLSSNASRVCSINGGVGFNNTDKETLGPWGGNYTTGFDGTGPNGYPGRDQPGYSTGQVLEPIYTWDNGPAATVTWAGGSASAEALLGTFIQAGREYLTTPRPGYTPLAYPHPLIGSMEGLPDAPPSDAKVGVAP